MRARAMTDARLITQALTSRSLLTDEMLARFDERAGVYDRENRFFDEDFDELRESGYLDAAIPRELGGAGPSLAEVARLQRRLAYHRPRPRSRSTCTCTGWASPPTCSARAMRAARGCSRRRPPATSSPPATASPGTTCRSSCRRRRRSASPAAGSSAATRSSAASRLCGPTSGPRDGRERPREPARGARLPRARRGRLRDPRDLGHAGHARDREQRHAARPRVRAARADRAPHAGRVRGRGPVPARDLRLGAARLRERVHRDRAPRLRPRARRRPRQALARPQPLDGVPPGGPAPRRRDADGARDRAARTRQDSAS